MRSAPVRFLAPAKTMARRLNTTLCRPKVVFKRLAIVFEYHLVPALPVASPAQDAPVAGRGGRGGGGGGGVLLGADPTKEGRYAIARSSGQTMMAAFTDEIG